VIVDQPAGRSLDIANTIKYVGDRCCVGLWSVARSLMASACMTGRLPGHQRSLLSSRRSTAVWHLCGQLGRPRTRILRRRCRGPL